MKRYDPEVAPDPTDWLSLDELERIDRVEAYHRRHRIKLPDIKVHAVVQAVVENQLAEGLECVCRAMTRLMGEGLSRHDSLHAIATVLMDFLREIHATEVAEPTAEAHARYADAVARLTAESWRRDFDEE